MNARRLTFGGFAALALSVITIMLHGRAVATLKAECDGDCVIEVNGNRYDNHHGGTYRYCFGSGFTDDQKTAIGSGFQYWVTAMGQNSYAPELAVAYDDGNNCDLVITEQSYGTGSENVIAQGNGNSNGAQTTMVFNTAYNQLGWDLSNMTLGTYAWVAAHEFGHIIGFHHAGGTNCSRDVSVMFELVPPNLDNGPPTIVKCVDLGATDSMYSPQGGGDDVQQEEWENGGYYWICDFHYTITIWRQFYGGQWHIVDITYELDYIDNCIPMMD